MNIQIQKLGGVRESSRKLHGNWPTALQHVEEAVLGSKGEIYHKGNEHILVDPLRHKGDGN